MVVEPGRKFETVSEVVLIKCKNSMFLQGCSSELVMYSHKVGEVLRDRFELKNVKIKAAGAEISWLLVSSMDEALKTLNHTLDDTMMQLPFLPEQMPTSFKFPAAFCFVVAEPKPRLKKLPQSHRRCYTTLFTGWVNWSLCKICKGPL